LGNYKNADSHASVTLNVLELTELIGAFDIPYPKIDEYTVSGKQLIKSLLIIGTSISVFAVQLFAFFKAHIMTNATVMDDAIRFVEEKQHSSSKTLSKTNSAENNNAEPKETSITEREAMATTNQIELYVNLL
jgi:hypothetical protein